MLWAGGGGEWHKQDKHAVWGSVEERRNRQGVQHFKPTLNCLLGGISNHCGGGPGVSFHRNVIQVL